jgi:hypothetical protein
MRITNKKMILVLFFFLFLVFYYIFNSEKSIVQEVNSNQIINITPVKKLQNNSNENNSMEVKKSIVKSSSKNIDIDENIDIDKMVLGLMNIDKNNTNLIEGNSIKVKNFFDEKKLLSWFTPYFSDEYIVGISISRIYQSNNREVGRIIKVDKKWTSYPPIELSDATSILIEKYPNLNFDEISGFFYLNDKTTPYYLFETQGKEKKVYYLVNAYSKQIIIQKSRTIEEEKKEDVSSLLDIDSDGLLHMKESFLNTLSEKEKIKMKKDIDETNEYIKKGLMQFDKDMNVILDKRPKRGVVTSEDTLSEERINEIIDSDYDDTTVLKVDYE